MAIQPVRSLYRKIQVVIDEASSGKPRTAKELAAAITSREPLDFTYYRVDERGRARVVPCAARTVERVVRFCVEIGLLDGSNCRLTKAGLRAASPKFIDREIRSGISAAMDQAGLPLDSVEHAITEILQQVSPERLPTWDGLREALKSRVDKRTFRSYLTLLSQSGGIGYTRKKIYLPKA